MLTAGLAHSFTALGPDPVPRPCRETLAEPIGGVWGHRQELRQTQPQLSLSCGSEAAHSGVGSVMPNFNFHQQN